jgi:hypothetical protein
LPGPDTFANPAPDVVLADPDAGIVLAGAAPDVVLAGPDADVLHRARSGAVAGAVHPSRDGLKRWALTAGGSRAISSFASAGSWASCAARPMMAIALEAAGGGGPAACDGRWPPG